MVVGSEGWAERGYIREVKDVQEASNTSRILKDIQEAFSRLNTEGQTKRLSSPRRRFYASSACRGASPVPTVATSEVQRFECMVPFQCLQLQRQRFYASSTCRGAIPVPTVATSEVLRFEYLSRCHSSAYSRNVGGSTLREAHEERFHGAYSRNVGGSTLRVPVELLFQCLQSQRRRFYACRGAISRRLSSHRRRFYAPSLKCHIRRDFKDTGHVAQHSAIPSFVRIRTKTNQLHNDRVVRFVVERGLLHRRFQSPTYNFGDEMK